MGAVNLDYLNRRNQLLPSNPEPATGPSGGAPVQKMPSGGFEYDPGIIGTVPGSVPSIPQPSSPFHDFYNNETRGVSQSSGPSPWQSGQGSFRDWFTGLQGQNNSQQWLEGIEGLLGQSGSKLTPANSIGERTKIWDPQANDWIRVLGGAEGHPVWNAQGWGQNGPQAQPGGVFNDPATQEWEKLLRTLVDRLQQPQPTYTDAQRELMQTQAIDPLERQRQAQKQNTMQRLAARGITGGSGVLEQALQDVDRQFDQMKTGQQTSFALNQVGREDQLFNSNEQRALAGLNLFSQIPQYADKRLQMAQGVLTPSNPYQLLTLQNQINQQGQYQQNYNQQQDQQFWQWIGQMLANSFAR